MHFELIRFCESITADVWYLYDDEARQILVKTRKHIGKEVQQRHQERVIPYNSKCKTNKAS